MPKTKYTCEGCGYRSPRWFGRCPDCGAWGGATDAPEGGAAVTVGLLSSTGSLERLPTHVSELDRVLGGGLVPGAVVLLSGEPGIGKSTLVLQLLAGVSGSGRRTLLATGEESLAQVSMRARRLKLDGHDIRAVGTSSLDAVLAAARQEHPDVVVVDSVQTLIGSGADGGAGSINQVRDCAATLVRHAKDTGCAVVLVGHVTKDGGVAGPKTLEHVVDVVMSLDGERSGTLRLLRAAKNRFGSCDETGVFMMSDAGLEPVFDPSALLLADRRPGVSGSVVFPGLEGSRPVLVEIQALVCPTKLPQARRVGIGIDARRLTLLMGVLSQRTAIELGGFDVFVAAAGGLAVREPAADLAIALALYSAAKNRAVDPGVVAAGEVGLAGEIRRVPGMRRRLAEAARLGFTHALVSPAIDVPRALVGVGALDLLAAFELVPWGSPRAQLRPVRAAPV